MFSLLFYIRQLNSMLRYIKAQHGETCALITIIGLYHIHIYLISDNYSLYRHRTWYMYWKADTRAYIVIVTVWDEMSYILLNDITELDKIFDKSIYRSFNRIRKKNITNKWHHHNHAIISFESSCFVYKQKIDFICKWFHQKKTYWTPVVFEVKVLFLIYIMQYKSNIWSFFLSFIRFSFSFDWQMRFFFLVH